MIWRWTIHWQYNEHIIRADEVEARFIVHGDRAVVLHNGSFNDPVAIVPYENFRLMTKEPVEELR
jgi:hypothetical protein